MQVSLINEPHTQVSFNKSSRLILDKEGSAIESSFTIEDDDEGRQTFGTPRK